jgi:hypothetical protein
MKNLVVIFLSLVLFSCAGGNKKTEDVSRQNYLKEVKNEVMDLHDEVMPLMGEMSSVRRKLVAQANELDEANEQKQLLMEAAKRIEVAEDLMMDWMRNYEVDFGDTIEEKISYQEEQRGKMSAVAIEMKEVLKVGKELVN